ncbi:MAG TPA: circadian clock KaiB family protein [Nitrospirota bacterium]|nr:circadian clock KaiB family protein [Nitrospirota bacterium]
MTASQIKSFAKNLKKTSKVGDRRKYVLKLYITGSTPRSTKAIMNIRQICEEHLKGHYELDIIDVFQQPVLAKGEQIIAAPTLIKKLPLPLRRFIGDMSDTDKILIGLDLRPINTHQD